MKNRMMSGGAVAVALVFGAVGATGASARVVGVVAAVEGAAGGMTVQVTAEDGSTKAIHTDASTHFALVRFSQRPHLEKKDASAITVGRCVDIELKGTAADVAKEVHYREKLPSAGSPCHALR